jgi:transcriptional regulator with XRE-family HTH domain
MDAIKRARLEAAGFKVGTVQEFLGLSRAESALIEVKLALSSALRHARNAVGLPQSELAKRMRSSQSRVAKIEACDPGVSTDLLLRALFEVGLSPAEVGMVIERTPVQWDSNFHGLPATPSQALRTMSFPEGQDQRFLSGPAAITLVEPKLTYVLGRPESELYSYHPPRVPDALGPISGTGGTPNTLLLREAA